MIVIIFKAILSSGLFLLAYKLLLEKEKMHQFNRFYLLFSLVLSLVIPFLTLTISVPVSIPIQDILVNTQQMSSTNYSSQLSSATKTNHWLTILWTLYALIATTLLIRFVVNLKTIFGKIRLTAVIPYRNSKLVMTNEKIVPYSFLNYIFVSREDFEQRNIEEEIFLHELTHARQKHTIDILFIELVYTVLWFNPFLILYRNAIQLNHEFLADEEVIHSNQDVPAYQHLLVSKSRGQTSSVFMSSFNYLITKKRLLMMTKTTSRLAAFAKQGASLFLFAGAILFFSSKTYAQTKPDQTVIPFPGKSQLKTDSTIIEMNSHPKKGYRVLGEDNKYLYLFASGKYYKLPKSQADKPLTKKSPTNTQLQTWMDEKMYGVWLNGVRIANSDLTKYQPTDLAWFMQSRLEKNAKNYGKHYYQVNLMTNESYERYLKDWKLRKPYVPDPDKTWQILHVKNGVSGGSWKDVSPKTRRYPDQDSSKTSESLSNPTYLNSSPKNDKIVLKGNVLMKDGKVIGVYYTGNSPMNPTHRRFMEILNASKKG